MLSSRTGLGKGSRSGGRFIYTSRADAEAKTGHFSLSSVKITTDLGIKISEYLRHEGFVTHDGVNQRHTSQNTYTLRFCLKMYSFTDKSSGEHKHYAYLDGSGRYGYMYQYGDDYKYAYVEDAPIGERHKKVYTGAASAKIEKLRAHTPSLEQMYFWICRKYPAHLLWADCSHNPPDPRWGFGSKPAAPTPISSIAFDDAPSWADTDKLSQYKAGVMLEAMERHNVPITYALDFINDPMQLARLVNLAADRERSGCSFAEQELEGAGLLAGEYRKLSQDEQQSLQATHDRLEQIKF